MSDDRSGRGFLIRFDQVGGSGGFQLGPVNLVLYDGLLVKERRSVRPLLCWLGLVISCV